MRSHLSLYIGVVVGTILLAVIKLALPSAGLSWWSVASPVLLIVAIWVVVVVAVVLVALWLTVWDEIKLWRLRRRQ